MHIKTALNLYKTKTRLAKALGISAARVSQWGESVPELYACKLQILSQGRLTATLDSTHKIDNSDTDPQRHPHKGSGQ